MSVAKFKVGRIGAGGANSEYITRVNAAEKISFFNLAHLESEDPAESRINAIAYAHAREDIELAKNKNGRTHYRLLLTFEGNESNETASDEGIKFLQNNFPDTRAILAVHQDTDDTHIHVWIDARKIDGNKLHLSKKEFETIDERWTQQYDQTYGTNYAPEYKAKKEETREWKRKIAMGEKELFVKDGVMHFDVPPKPERAGDKFDYEYWRNKEKENLGLKQKSENKEGRYEENRLGTDHSIAQRRERFTQATELVTAAKSESRGTDNYLDSEPERRFESQSGEVGRDNQSDQELTKIGEGYSNAGINTETAEIYGDGHFENQNIRQQFSSESDIYSEGDSFTSTETSGTQISEEQFYEDRFGFDYQSGEIAERTNFAERGKGSLVGGFELELTSLPSFEFIEPQLNTNAQELVNETFKMVTDSFERLNIELDESCLTYYRESLKAMATLNPSPSQIETVNRMNQRLPEDDKILVEDKSRLEIEHEYLSKMSNNQRDEAALEIAAELDEEIELRFEQDPDSDKFTGFRI